MSMFCECGCGGRTTISDKTDRKYGWVKDQPKRFMRGHRHPVRNAQDAWEKLIQPKTEQRGECLIYTGTVDHLGYGSVMIGGKTGQRHRIHRISYAVHNGPLVDSLFVLHGCDNPSCVNPKHLRLGTAADNSADMVERGRAPNVGARCHAAVLTDQVVRDIRARSEAGEKGCDIAADLGVSQMCISQVINRKTWRHI
jgi:hypothetical protein